MKQDGSWFFTPHPTQVLARFHCIHMQISETADMQCHSISVCGIQRAQTTGMHVSEARAPGGPCGIEARFLVLTNERKLRGCDYDD